MSYINKQIINGIYQGTDWKPNTNTRAYWKLDEDILDYSGHDFHFIGGDDIDKTGLTCTTPQIADGKFGSARFFNGSTSMLYYQSNIDGPITTALKNHWTISLWMHWTAGESSDKYIFRPNGRAAGAESKYSIYAYQDTIKVAGNGAAAGGTFNEGWNHAVLTCEDGLLTPYLNGQSGATQQATLEDITTDALKDTIYDVAIGGSSYAFDAGSCTWKGGICEIIIESVTWHENDVLSYYNKYK